MASTAPPSFPPRADDPRPGDSRPGGPGVGDPRPGDRPGDARRPAAPRPVDGGAPGRAAPGDDPPPGTSFVARLLVLPAQVRRWLRPDPARPPRRWPRRYWLGLVALYAAVAAIAAGDAWVFTCGFEGCPSTADIRALRPSEGGRILDRQGALVGRVRSVRRVNVPLATVPLHVRQAFIATEDRRFYDHRGVDWRGAARATLVNLRAGGVREGFSTVTMQVVRNTFAVQRQGERSVARKLLELRLSRLIEGALTKDQILELYLNVIYLGNGVYGVEAASRDLFGRGVRQVTLAQGAVLAALPKGPSAYTPRAHPQRARRRRDLVLSLMARDGYVSADRARRAQGERLTVAEDEWRPDASNDSYALDAVRQFVDSLREAEGLESGDLVVETTLDMTAQRAAERAVARRAAAIGAGAQGAMVALDPRTGDVRALVGGRAYGNRYTRGTFNRALRARRQPGSAFKPFVYAAALARGMTPATGVDDEPIEVSLGNGRVWTPGNYEGSYLGHTTLRTALAKSANGATVRVGQEVGPARVVEVAQRAGITSRLQPVPSLALGAVEVTPMELVAAYAPFANGGFRVAPRMVARVRGRDGAVLWANEPKRRPVMDARDAFLLTSMLRSVVLEGTGRALADAGVRDPVAGKTGTTNSGTDAWFVGYTPTLVAGFWFGYDDPRPMGQGATGGRLAAPAWADFYQSGWREHAGDWAPPAGLVRRSIDAYTGHLANEFCPATREEWFKRGSEPTTVCREHTEPVYEPPPEPTYDTPAPGAPQPPIVDEARKAGKKVGGWFKRVFKF